MKLIPRVQLHHLLCLWALAFLAYANSFQAGLIFDNRLAIVEDTRVHAAG